jgi:hypothetical protein
MPLFVAGYFLKLPPRADVSSPIGNRTAQLSGGSAQSKASDAQSKPIFPNPLK